MSAMSGWLLICDPPQQSLTQLADALSVSKASVSTVARQLREAGMAERLPSPNRQHLYRVTPLSQMLLGIEACEFGLSVLGADRAEQRERVEDFRHFCEFCTHAYRDESLRMWSDYRAKGDSDD
jgi:DNA-binding MarR family transcriptional regulator